MNIKNNLIAHRGMFNNKDIPENSYLAFKEAIRNEYDFELDIHLTRDNELVVFHDYNLKRMCNVDINVQETTYEELLRYNLLNTKEKIPLLRDILKLNKDRSLVDIEIKNTKRIKQTVYFLVKELENYNNYVVKSFNPRIIRYIRKNYPKIECGLLLTHDYKNMLYNLLLRRKFMIRYSKANFIAIDKILYNRDQYKDLKMPIFVWNIKNIDEIIIDKDVINVCNNLPVKKKY